MSLKWCKWLLWNKICVILYFAVFSGNLRQEMENRRFQKVDICIYRLKTIQNGLTLRRPCLFWIQYSWSRTVTLALWQLLRLEVVTKRAFLAKNDTGRRAVSKYDAWAMHPPKDDTRPVCVLKYDTRPVCLLKYDTRSPCIQKYDSERPHSQKDDALSFLCKKN